MGNLDKPEVLDQNQQPQVEIIPSISESNDDEESKDEADDDQALILGFVLPQENAETVVQWVKEGELPLLNQDPSVLSSDTRQRQDEEAGTLSQLLNVTQSNKESEVQIASMMSINEKRFVDAECQCEPWAPVIMVNQEENKKTFKNKKLQVSQDKIDKCIQESLNNPITHSQGFNVTPTKQPPANLSPLIPSRTAFFERPQQSQGVQQPLSAPSSAEGCKRNQTSNVVFVPGFKAIPLSTTPPPSQIHHAQDEQSVSCVGLGRTVTFVKQETQPSHSQLFETTSPLSPELDAEVLPKGMYNHRKVYSQYEVSSILKTKRLQPEDGDLSAKSLASSSTAKRVRWDPEVIAKDKAKRQLQLKEQLEERVRLNAAYRRQILMGGASRVIALPNQASLQPDRRRDLKAMGKSAARDDSELITRRVVVEEQEGDEEDEDDEIEEEGEQEFEEEEGEQEDEDGELEQDGEVDYDSEENVPMMHQNNTQGKNRASWTQNMKQWYSNQQRNI